MSGYYELCRCGHTRYLHTWVPDPANPDAAKRNCQSCCCTAFEGTGDFSLPASVSEAAGHRSSLPEGR